MPVAVIGAGWAGCVAAVELMRRGHQVVLLEAARAVGGRARRLDLLDQGQWLAVDNGQHILIGAYRETLRMMRSLGLQPPQLLKRLPLTLQRADGCGLSLPHWRHRVPAGLAVGAGILRARGWSLSDKFKFLRWALGWQLQGFECAQERSVLDLCGNLPKGLVDGLIAPLCVSALNTPVDQASGSVFLRVLREALMSSRDGSDLLLPLCDLGSLLPQAAAQALREQGQTVSLGARVLELKRGLSSWQLEVQQNGQRTALEAQAVVLACPSGEAARLVSHLPQARSWQGQALALRHRAIATVYLQGPQVRLPLPMLALQADDRAPAQFVFDRGQLGGPEGLLAFVVSDSQGDRLALEQSVLAQAEKQLGLGSLRPVQTVVERRATFACTPGLQRPGLHVLPDDRSLLACGDYIAGPYPATLEGAVRSGLNAAAGLT